MATLNQTRKSVTKATIAKEQTVNYHGETAYNYNAHARLVERVLGSFWNENLFYASGKKISSEIVKDINEVLSVDPKFVLQLAAFARNEIYLRTAPQVLLVHAANYGGSKQYIQEYAPKIVKRADELGEVMAYQLSQFGKPIPNSLKKGLAIAFTSFDEYQLNKYDSQGDSVKLGDVLRLISRKAGYPVSRAMYDYLVHDKVSEELPKIFALKQLLAKDKIDAEAKSLIKTSGVTWESMISKFGASKETWELVAPNMGYMALLRNLRNFIDKGVELDSILEKLQNEEQVKRSKQLPFRFYSAYKNVRDNQQVQRAIAKAFEYSITNVTLPGTTAVVVDLSGSMSMGKVSEKSDVTYAEIGAILGAIAGKKAANSVFIKFGDRAKVTKNINPDDTMMTNINKLMTNDGVGHGTNPVPAIKLLPAGLDRVLLLSDMQCYSSYYGVGDLKSAWNTYHKANPKARLYSFDLSSYGTSQFPSTDGSVTTLNGWSDKVLDFINLQERKDVMVEQIRKY